MSARHFSVMALCFLFALRTYANGEVTSPNMGLTIPAVGVTIGPTWASDIDDSLNLIDLHDHSAGNGVQITPSGINISSDLSCNSHNLTTVRTVRFSSQSSPITASSPDVGALYESGNDLYYNDGAGNQVRITQGGSVSGSAGTITGLPSGTASAAYSGGSGTFTFQQSTSTAANLDVGTAILRYPGSYPAPAGNYIALEAPTTLATGYAITLPATLPGTSGAFLTESTTGALSYTNVDNSTIQLSSSTLAVKSGGITVTQMASSSVGTSQLVAASVTQAKLAALPYVATTNISGSSLTSTTEVSLISTSALTTTGRPVMVGLTPFDATVNAYMSVLVADAYVIFYIDTTRIGVWQLGPTAEIPFAAPIFYAGASAGSHTFTLKYFVDSGATLNIVRASLYAYEL